MPSEHGPDCHGRMTWLTSTDDDVLLTACERCVELHGHGAAAAPTRDLLRTVLTLSEDWNGTGHELLDAARALTT